MKKNIFFLKKNSQIKKKFLKKKQFLNETRLFKRRVPMEKKYIFFKIYIYIFKINSQI